jgi:hypothetical protein
MDNSNYWRKQMDWKSSEKERVKKQPYDPESVWNIEGPTRKKVDTMKRKDVVEEMSKLNLEQREMVQ